MWPHTDVAYIAPPGIPACQWLEGDADVETNAVVPGTMTLERTEIGPFEAAHTSVR
jgi:hypothetical protein